MYALIENNAVTQVGELSILFPNTSNPTHAFAIVVTRTYVNTPKALEDVTETPEGQTEPVTTKGLKSQWIAQNKASANSQLASTDWMVIRKAERDVAIPSDVVTERAKIIADCTAKEAAITAATTVEALIAVVNS